MVPLLVQVLFHPKSEPARLLAQHLYSCLNQDPVLPGLRVPVLFAHEHGQHAPPSPLDLEQAERNFVVVLADEEMDADERWCSFIADEWQSSSTLPSAQVLPIQLSEHAWPLDERLEQVNFSRAWSHAEGEARRGWVASRVVLELLRFVDGLDSGETAPIQLFISHTKLDIDAPPRVFAAICKFLDARQPVRRWIDSAKIPGGSSFDREIAEGVEDSALLVLLTDNYSSRTWCRREVLLAKRHQRPIVVIDALQELELRSFPYLGNVPVRRWLGGEDSERSASLAVNLLIKEALRHAATRLWLESVKDDDDLLLVSPPELINLRFARSKRAILYPDPALPDEERELLEGPAGQEERGLRLETPMQRRVAEGGLDGETIALSVSESVDLADAGMFAAHFDDMLLTLSRELLLRGAKLAYGGHLGSQGYTMRLFELARSYRNRDGIPPVEKIINYVGWPMRVGAKQISQFKNQARFVETPRPEGVAELEPETFVERPTHFPADSAPRRYAWARGMTTMRERQTAEVDARVIIGGVFGPTVRVTPEGERRLGWYSSRIPGVLEELLLSLEAGQPVYIVGAFGGVGKLAVDLLEGRDRPEMSWDYQKDAPEAPGMRALYEQRDQWRSYAEMRELFTKAAAEGLPNNGLSREQNAELWTTRDVERATTLIVEGLLRVGSSS